MIQKVINKNQSDGGKKLTHYDLVQNCEYLEG